MNSAWIALIMSPAAGPVASCIAAVSVLIGTRSALLMDAALCGLALLVVALVRQLRRAYQHEQRLVELVERKTRLDLLRR